MVHEGLEHSGHIGEPHRHDEELEGAVLGVKCSLPFMAGCNVHIVVASAQVKFGVDLGIAQLIEEVHNEGDRVLILLSDLVQVPEVDTESQGAIFFVVKEDRGTSW